MALNLMLMVLLIYDSVQHASSTPPFAALLLDINAIELTFQLACQAGYWAKPRRPYTGHVCLRFSATSCDHVAG